MSALQPEDDKAGEWPPGSTHGPEPQSPEQLQLQYSASKYSKAPGAQLLSKPRFRAVLLQLSEQVLWSKGWGQETGQGGSGTQSSSSVVHSASWAVNWLTPHVLPKSDGQAPWELGKSPVLRTPQTETQVRCKRKV